MKTSTPLGVLDMIPLVDFFACTALSIPFIDVPLINLIDALPL